MTPTVWKLLATIIILIEIMVGCFHCESRTHPGRCTQFWYMGCGGNANNFYSYDVCMRTCRVEKRRLERRPRASSTGSSAWCIVIRISSACYKPAAVTGQCPSKLSRPVQRWTYHNMKCATFMYTGCGGNENRFSTEIECKETCANHKPSADPGKGLLYLKNS